MLLPTIHQHSSSTAPIGIGSRFCDSINYYSSSFKDYTTGLCSFRRSVPFSLLLLYTFLMGVQKPICRHLKLSVLMEICHKVKCLASAPRIFQTVISNPMPRIEAPRPKYPQIRRRLRVTVGTFVVVAASGVPDAATSIMRQSRMPSFKRKPR
jgi:hypothetical protein